MLGQIFGDDGGGNAPISEVAIDIQPGRDHRGFDRVQHIEAGGEPPKAVPAFVVAQYPVIALADALFCQLFRPPYFKPPGIAELFIHLAHRATKIECLQNRFFHQCGAARRFHHRRRHIARGDNCVLRRGRSVHQVGFVEAVVIQLACL